MESPSESPHEDIMDIIKAPVKRFVKYDDTGIDHIQTAGISAYTNNPLNICILGPSGEGKTWLILNSLIPFPKEDLIILASGSATFFYHDHGVLVDEDGLPLEDRLDDLSDEIEEEKKKGKAADRALINQDYQELRKLRGSGRTLIDLRCKILVFLDAQAKPLWDRLRPILSHDMWETSFKFTDRQGNSGLGTKHVIIRGWPAVIFAAAEDESSVDEWPQLKNRFVMINPNMSKEKYRAGNQLSADLLGLPTPKLREMFPKGELERAKEVVKSLSDELKDLTLVSARPGDRTNLTWNPFRNKIVEGFNADVGEDMRYFKQYLAYVNVETLKHLTDRPLIKFTDVPPETYVVTCEADIKNVDRMMWSYFKKKLPQSKVDFYHDAFQPAFREAAAKRAEQNEEFHGLTASEVHQWAEEHNVKTGKDFKQTRQHWLDPLELAGYITAMEDPADRRKLLYRPKVSDSTPTLQGRFGAEFDREMMKRELESILKSAPKSAVLLYRGKQVDQDGLMDVVMPNSGFGGLISEPTSLESAPNEPRPERADSARAEGALESMDGAVPGPCSATYYRCTDCGAGVFNSEKECRNHKALKGNEGHLFMEFDTIQAATKWRPGREGS